MIIDSLCLTLINLLCFQKNFWFLCCKYNFFFLLLMIFNLHLSNLIRSLNFQNGKYSNYLKLKKFLRKLWTIFYCESFFKSLHAIMPTFQSLKNWLHLIQFIKCFQTLIINSIKFMRQRLLKFIYLIPLMFFTALLEDEQKQYQSINLLF